ncbi:MAG: radical SAM protein [Candidatus Omnitrophica bacterium]|nr:radical SAM protein [Candidatus Omnitrophota bacterium]
MPIIQPVIRPPSEADSFLLQVTTGCSANSCTFCGAYLNKPFKVKSFDEITRDIEHHARRHPGTRRVFLMDGDALVLQNERLIPVLQILNKALPQLNRVSSYANGYNIIGRSLSELSELYDNRLRLIYIGLESGAQSVLDRCLKRSTVQEMVAAVQYAAAAHIKSSVIVLLGLGGRAYSDVHVRETITALNQMQPRYLSFLSLMVIPGTQLHRDVMSGEFNELNAQELLQEMHDIIEGLELSGTIFRTDHASNYLPLEGRFPQDKQRFLDSLKGAISGKISLRPDMFRGL